jgi:peptidoglycan hydrolase-like protein with peptidoglycan-binding domain
MSAYHRHKRDYKNGLDALAGDMGTGGAPSVDMDFVGPPPIGYTDKGTILAVQKKLISLGYSVGKTGADGIFGKDTETALYKYAGKHGPPDDETLRRLGVNVGGGGSAAASAPSSSSKSYSSLATSPSEAHKAEEPGFFSKEVPGIHRPLWQVLVGAVGIIAVGTGIILAFRGSSRSSHLRLAR